MRALTFQETQTTHGGIEPLTIAAGVVTAVVAYGIYSAFFAGPSCKTHYEPVYSYYDVSTPVYQGGVLIGYNVETYEHFEGYETVVICS